MGNRKKTYKRSGGVLAIPREMIQSQPYLSLSLAARCLLLVLQDVWRPAEYKIHFSVRRAAKLLNVSMATASRAFKELEDGGFIRMAMESDWINGAAREWLLTWMPNNDREPTDDWKQDKKIDHTFHQSNGQGPNRYRDETVTEIGRARPRKINNLQPKLAIPPLPR